MDVISAVLLPLDVLNALLHSTGIYLLWKIYIWKEITTQQLIVFHLSIAEGLMNTSGVVFEVLFLTSNGEYAWYVIHIENTLLVVIYMIMFFMTVDRLMAVVLSWKYKVYWRVGRTKKVLAVVWLLGIMCGVCSAFLYKLDSWRVFINVTRYVGVVFSVLFLAIALLTYVIIYWKNKKSARLLQNHKAQRENDQQQSTRQQSHKIRFYIPGLIILTYLICDTIPLIIIAVFGVPPNKFWLGAVLIILDLGYTSDALIYIFLQTKVRNHLLRQSRGEQSNNAETDSRYQVAL